MSILREIKKIQTIFQEAREVALKSTSQEEVLNYIKEDKGDYVGVGYEGVSMGVALNSIDEFQTLEIWKEYQPLFNNNFTFQIHIGLGWALAKKDVQLNSILTQFSPTSTWRILDGYGYYSGMFKRRECIRKMLIPKTIEDKWLSGYHQGLGRSLWYIAQGNPSRLLRIVELFDIVYHENLWRGIGIAIAYVSGATLEVLEETKKFAGSNLPSLKCGVAFALFSRQKSESESAKSVLVCDFFLDDFTNIINRVGKLENANYTSIEEYNSSIKEFTRTL